MISYIKGNVKSSNIGNAIIIANGVGYDIHIATLMPIHVNKEIELFIYTHFNNGEISLWGFEKEKEKQLFQKLLSVSGVGPKSAQLLLLSKSINEIIHAINTNDLKALKVKGLGEKTLKKIVLELKDVFNSDSPVNNLSQKDTKQQQKLAYVEDALLSLGYSSSEIKNKYNKLDKVKIETAPAEELIRILLHS